MKKEIEPDVDLENDMRAEDKHQEDVDNLLNCAIKEGYLSDVDGWTEQEKEAYYKNSMETEYGNRPISSIYS